MEIQLTIGGILSPFFMPMYKSTTTIKENLRTSIIVLRARIKEKEQDLSIKSKTFINDLGEIRVLKSTLKTQETKLENLINHRGLLGSEIKSFSV